MKELNLENELINNICNFNNKNFSCDSVLKSPFAREFNFFTLPELGIMYFAGGLLGIIFLVLSGSRPDYFWLALISVIFGPFSIIALLYQYFVVKKWCILCVVVQVALIAESIFAINYLNGFEASNLDFASFLSVFISLIIPISMWILLRHSFFNSTRVDLLTEQLNWFKRSPTVFSNIIDSQKEHDISLFKHELSFGNGNKANNITAVINFRCLSCRKSIKELVFISNHSESTKINIRFDFVNRAEDNNEIGLRLFKLLIENEEQAKVALLDWFKINNKYEMDRWLYKYPMPAVYEIKSINDLMDAHKNWFKSIGVEYSPVYFLNGRVIPSIYYIEDIKLHVRN